MRGDHRELTSPCEVLGRFTLCRAPTTLQRWHPLPLECEKGQERPFGQARRPRPRWLRMLGILYSREACFGALAMSLGSFSLGT